MHATTAQRFFAGGMIFSFVLLLGMAWSWFIYSNRSHRLMEQTVQLEGEFGRLQRETGGGREPDLLGAEIDRVNAWNESMRTRLAAEREVAIDETLTRSKAYFAIQTFVEKWRTRAQENRIMLRRDERFGFSAYSHAGPEEDEMSDVLRQMQAMDRVLEILMAANPEKIISLQRAKAAGVASGSRASEDYFDALVFSRTEKTKGLWFRLSFTGNTQVAREIINRFSALDSRMVVREVSVAPLLNESGVRSSEQAKPLEVVGIAGSKFEIVVEFPAWTEEKEAQR